MTFRFAEIDKVSKLVFFDKVFESTPGSMLFVFYCLEFESSKYLNNLYDLSFFVRLFVSLLIVGFGWIFHKRLRCD